MGGHPLYRFGPLDSAHAGVRFCVARVSCPTLLFHRFVEFYSPHALAPIVGLLLNTALVSTCSSRSGVGSIQSIACRFNSFFPFSFRCTRGSTCVHLFVFSGFSIWAPGFYQTHW